MKENDIWRQQSMVIDWLRFPLIILVVYIHNRGKGALPIEEIDWSFHRGIDFYSWLSYSICRVIASIAVPSFFIISGYFFFWKVKEWCFAVYKEKLRVRFKTLLVPYILWNVISLIAPIVWHLAIAWHSSQHITYLNNRNKVGIEETKEILTNYLARQDRNINKLYRYAEELSCLKILKTYLEVLV